MKNLIPMIAVLAMLFQSCTNGEAERLEQAKDLYSSAVDMKDATTARVALVQLIQLDTANMEYRDSLARIYITSGNYEAGTMLGQEVIDAGRGDTKLKELTGVAYQQLLQMDKATAMFNDLFNNTADFRYAYQVASIASEIGNTADFDTLTNRLLTTVASDSLVAQTVIDFPGPVTGQTQLVPIEAATLFLIGKYAVDKQQDVGKAVYYFEASIAKFPTFELPYYYLEQLKNPQARR